MAAPGECDAGQRLGQWRTGGNGMHAHSPFLARTRNYLAGIRRNVGGGRITSGASQRAILPAAERFRNEQIGKRDCCSNWSAFDSSHALELRGRDYRRHMAYHTGQLGLAGIRAFFHIHFVIRHQLCSYAGTPLVLRTGRFCHGEGRYVIGLLAALLGNLWTDAVMTVWCVGCFVVALGYYSDGSVWPYLLWAYGMATGPWTYMAAREGQDAVGSTLAAFGACMGVIGIMGVILFASHPSIIDITIAFCIPISVVLILQVGMAIALVKSKDTFLSPA